MISPRRRLGVSARATIVFSSDEFRQRRENAPNHCGNATDLLRAARPDLRDWSKAADRADVNGGFGPGTNKCNLFVDAQYESASYDLPNRR